MGFKKEKLDGIKNTWPRRIGKVLLWSVIILLLVRGVGSFVTGSRSSQQQKTLDQYIAAAELRESIRAGAAAFAENFIRDYYTFDGTAGSDYKQRVERYLAQSLDIREPLAGVNKTLILSANPTVVTFLSEELVNVDVLLLVSYIPLKENGSAAQTKEFTMRVPVACKEGSYAIDQLPQFVPNNKTADISKATGYSGVEVDSDQKQKIKTFLEDFLKTYYAGSESELAYYITEDFNEPQGLQGVVSFDRLLQFTASYDVEKEEYVIGANIITMDNGQTVEQHLSLLAVQKEDGKYYMKSITTR